MSSFVPKADMRLPISPTSALAALSRRAGAALCVCALAVVMAACGTGSKSAQPGVLPGQHTVTITDVLGRKVTLAVPATRILLGGQRLLYTTALLNKADPTANVVGWPRDLLQNDPDTYQRYLRQFPKIAQVPEIGDVSEGSLSAEQAIELRPNVFVISAATFKAAQDAGIVDQLAKAGIPTVVVDYFVDPIRDTVPSIRLMGQLFGRDAEAEQYIAYYQSAVKTVRDRLAAAHQPPTPTFLWRAPGYYDCCSSFARSNLGALVSYAGGDNLADSLLSTKQGTLSPETLLSHNPAVIIATGADWAPGSTPAAPGSFVALGYNETAQAAASQLSAIIAKQPGFANLQAVTGHRTYVVWHHFYDSPYNYLAIQWFAKWMHPDLFPDIDPNAGIRDLHQKFLPIPPGGTFWTGLS